MIYLTGGAGGGLINLFGWIKGNRATIDANQWHVKGLTVVNSSPRAQLRNTFPPAIRLIHRGIVDLNPLVTHVATLEDYPVLMRNLVKGDPTYIKEVVTL